MTEQLKCTCCRGVELEDDYKPHSDKITHIAYAKYRGSGNREVFPLCSNHAEEYETMNLFVIFRMSYPVERVD